MAAGLTGVKVALAHTLAEAGLRRGVKALRLPQPGPTGSTVRAARGRIRRHRSDVEFCENGAKAVAEEATVRAGSDREFFAAHSIADLRARSDHWLGKQGRLTAPMSRRRATTTTARSTGTRPSGWSPARSRDAGRTPIEAVFYTSGRTSNEAAFLYQLFVRMLGTNNLPDCSNMCHESSGVALTETVGVGKGTVSLYDIERGRPPGHRRRPEPGDQSSAHAHDAARRPRRTGRSIIAVNPLPEAGLIRFKNPQTAERASWVGEPRWPTCSSR